MSFATQAEETYVHTMTENLRGLCASTYGHIPTDWTDTKIRNGTSTLGYWQDWIREANPKWDILAPCLRRLARGGDGRYRPQIPTLDDVRAEYSRELQRIRHRTEGRPKIQCTICCDGGAVYVPLWRRPGASNWTLAKEMRPGPYETAYAAIACRCDAGKHTTRALDGDAKQYWNAWDYRCTTAAYMQWRDDCRELRPAKGEEPEPEPAKTLRDQVGDPVRVATEYIDGEEDHDPLRDF